MQSGQGGIRWNSTTKTIQLMDENKNWVNWSYYNPTSPVSLIPTDINSNSYRRADGVTITLTHSGGNLLTEPYMAFKLNNNYYQAANTATFTIEFSIPQVITSFQFYNYSSNSTAVNILVQSSVDGSTYKDLMTYRDSGANGRLEIISLSNPSAVKYFRLMQNSGGNYSNTYSFYRDATLYGYSYSA